MVKQYIHIYDCLVKVYRGNISKSLELLLYKSAIIHLRGKNSLLIKKSKKLSETSTLLEEKLNCIKQSWAFSVFFLIKNDFFQFF